MKKITMYLVMLLGVTAFSQVEIVENFDTTPTNQVPAGWSYTSNFRASSNFACGGSGNSAAVGLQAGNSGTLTTANYTAITNATDLTVSFSLNLFEQVSQFPPPSYAAPATAWGSFILEYSIDGGSNWITAVTINDSNFTYVGTTTCVDIAPVNIGALAAGTDFQARFVANAVNVDNFALWFILDNISITQVATTVPNCDATLLSPLNGSTTADTDATLFWEAATGLPTGYTVSVGTTSGGTDILNAATTSETNYPLDGLGLAYETEYFVNIVPYNGFGNATGCTEESFTTRVAPIPGATCGSPIVINSFPYIEASGNTANYEDNIDVSPCSNTYMAGKDVFYQITPVTDISINIDLASIDNNGASIHVLDACPDVATTCVAFTGVFSGATRNLSEVVLFAGNTYFIVLSNSSNTRTYNYDLIITQNSCINPEFTLTPVADCGNGQFSVDVNVTYMGDATSLTLSDDDGTTADVAVPSTGVYTVGPYTSGTTVNFTLTHDQDGSCSYSDSTYFYCPPTNDECANAIALTVNTDGTCTNVLSASNAGATESLSDPLTCGSNTNDVWFSFVAASETMVLEYSNVTAVIGSGGTIQATELLEGSCGSLTSLVCRTGAYVTFNGLSIGNTYYIRNNTNLGGEYAQSFDICIRTLPTAPANDECSNATVLTASTDNTCNNAVAGTTIGATTSTENTCSATTYDYGDVWYVFNPANSGYYEFSLERLSTTPTTYFTVFSGTCGSLVEKSTSCTTNANQLFYLSNTETYYVQVRSAQIGAGIDFNLCVYQLPDAVINSDCSSAINLLESTDLNGNNAITANINTTDIAYYSSEGCASSTYESVWYTFTPNYTGTYNFDFTRVSGSANYTVYNTDNCTNTTSAGYITGFTSCYNSTDKTGDLVAGNTYLIFVNSSAAAEFTLFVYPDPSLGISDASFEGFKYYPNPVENTLTVKAANSISEISIHNFIGQQVQVIRPNSMSSTMNLEGLTNGVYFVTVSINNSQKTFKVIKK